MGIHVPAKLLMTPELYEPGRKPNGSLEIDWNNPITKDLRVCLLYQNGTPINLVTKNELEKSAGVSIGPAKYGRMAAKGFAGGFGTEYYRTTDSISGTDSRGPLTVFSYHRLASGQDGQQVHLIDGGGNCFNFYHEGWGVRALRLARKWNSAASTITHAADDTIKASVSHIGNKWEDSDAIFVINGVKETISVANATLFDTTAGVVYSGNNKTQNREFDGDIYLQLVWTRVLTPAEQFAIDADPYHFLKPKLGGL